MHVRKTLAIVAALLLTACATHPQPGAPISDNSLITREQVGQNNFRDAYEAVSTLHSNWLSAHGEDGLVSSSEVLVYLDDMLLGGVDQLRNITASTIGFVRHYDGLEATTRWGVNHGAGVIYVSTREQAPK